MVWRTNPHLDAKPRSRKCAELVFRTARGEIRPRPVGRDAAARRQHRPPVHRRGADEDARRRLHRGQRAAGHPRHERGRGLPVRRRRADGHGLGRDRRRRSRRGARCGALDGRPGVGASARRSTRPSRRSRKRSTWRSARYRGPRPLGDVDPVPADGTPLAAPAAGTARRRSRPRPGPIVLMDVGDNIGGGSSADSTVILARGAAPRDRLAAPDAVRPRVGRRRAWRPGSAPR